VFLDVFKFQAIDHITVQIDNIPALSFSAFTNVDTPADPVAAVDGTKVDSATDDCFIWMTVQPVKLGAPEPSGDLLASRIAHEVFHCLQSWNFPGTDSPLPTGLWWSEGSAKAMEMLVSQWPATIPKWAKVFDETSAFRITGYSEASAVLRGGRVPSYHRIHAAGRVSRSARVADSPASGARRVTSSAPRT